ncbi:MAG: DUF2752 domain-containing protein [Acidobacteria bacterium]|nr:DUF2752 domain-containing protein [Acidobacteriota bacterium]
MKPGEWRLAFRWVWRILSLVALGVLVAPFLLSADKLAVWTPVCLARREGSSCALCGMTTAFAAIAQGRWRDAQALNRGSLPLYAFLALNQLGLVLDLYHRRRSRRGGKL